ncbi:membrane protein [Saccharopolyspora halophila]|uniref:Membrane protein n=1 Tax=Saccharopolyspora halophila TaxID=405551 RepID=A0ABP5SV04_9PSEU
MQIPGPDTRVVEVRVHGILGTTGEDLTDSVASVDVAGDGIGRIVRPADRLLRPVPGPQLTAGERSVPRIVEGYLWGAMTSGGLAKAAWALLFPFALANMAHWMLPPRPANSAGRALSGTLRALLRVSALLLTMLFVAQLTVITLDLVAAQCLRPGAQCMTAVPEVVRGLDVLRSSVALLPVALVIGLMYWLSTSSWEVSAPKTEGAKPSGLAPVLPGENVVSDPDTPALRVLHVAAALSTVALLVLGGPFAAGPDPRWLLAAALTAAALVGAAALDDPSGMRSNRTLRALLGRKVRRALLIVSAVLLASVALVPPRLAGELPGSGPTIDTITGLLVAVCLAVGVLLVPAILLARSGWKSSPRELRPWAGGWMAAPVLMLAAMLGNGFGAGLALSVRQTLGVSSSRGTSLVLPRAFDDVTIFWGTAALLLAVTAAVAVPWTLFRRWRHGERARSVPDEVELLHAGRKEDQQAAGSAWTWADLQRRYSHQMFLVLAGVLTASTALTLAARFAGLEFYGWRSALGVVVLAGLAVGLMRIVFLAATKRNRSRQLGVLGDLSLFWPREAHPVVPPCYALKVIPELVDRVTEHLSEPNTRVVLVGHSQGSLLAAVTAARLVDALPEQDLERVGLVTAGSQLQWAYPRAFPGAVPHQSLLKLSGDLGGRWRSLCRGTDPLGGGVTTWNRQVYGGMLIGVGFKADGTEGPLPAATRGPTGALVLGGDHWLPDPQRGPFSCRRWVPGVMGHSEYSGDPEWDRAVAMAAGLETPVRGAALPLQPETPAPTQIPSAPDLDKRPLPVRGTDGGSLDEEVPHDREQPRSEESERPEPDEPTAEPSADESGAESLVPEQDAPVERSEPAVLPEITEPRGRIAPWERGSALRSSEH